MRKFKHFGGRFDCDLKEEQRQKLEKEISDSFFWNQDRSETDKVIENLSQLKNELTPLKEMKIKFRTYRVIRARNG